jgi:hypothetical protein
MGQMAAKDTLRWKHDIFESMERWRQEPNGLLPPSASR